MYIGFARCCTASECLEFLLKVITIATQLQTCYRSFEFVVPMILVVGFMGNAINYFQEPLASVLFCMDDRFYPRIFGMFSKLLFFFGSNLSVTQNYCVFSEVHWFLPTLHEF